MKKVIRIFLAAMVCMAMFFIASTVMAAFNAPGGALYGVTSDGTYFLSADLVKAANGSMPKVMVAPNFKPEAMKLDGNYYVYTDGSKSLTVYRCNTCGKMEFCFDIGGGQYIPHVLVNDNRIKQEDIADNGIGGQNFRMTPK